MMLKNLKNRLDRGEILFASGSDRPGEAVIYCTKDTYQKAAEQFIERFYDDDSMTVEKLTEGFNINTDAPYIKLVQDWNSTGDIDILTSDNIKGLHPDTSFYAVINDYMVNNGILSLDQVEFEDSNSAFVDNLSYINNVPEEAFATLYLKNK